MGPGKKDEWYTPPEIFKALNLTFDLDPCHPNQETFVPAIKKITKQQDGLSCDWSGVVWLNPPFGGRNGYFPWVEKFIQHGNGIGLITSLTSSEGFQKFIPQMEAILFPKSKTRFYESIDKKGGCPFNGVVVFAIGGANCEALKNSGLGLYLKVKESQDAL